MIVTTRTTDDYGTEWEVRGNCVTYMGSSKGYVEDMEARCPSSSASNCWMDLEMVPLNEEYVTDLLWEEQDERP